MDSYVDPLPNYRSSASNNNAMLTAIIVLAIALVLTLIASVSFYIKIKEQKSSNLERFEASSHLLVITEHAEQSLDEYLLTGMGSRLDELSKSEIDLRKTIEKLRNADSSPETQRALNSLSNAYQTRLRDFAQPVIQKRKDVDAGESTMGQMDIFYLDQDPERKFSALKNAVLKVQDIEKEAAQ